MSPLLYRLGYATTNKENITWCKNCVNSNFSKNAFFYPAAGIFLQVQGFSVKMPASGSCRNSAGLVSIFA